MLLLTPPGNISSDSAFVLLRESHFMFAAALNCPGDYLHNTVYGPVRPVPGGPKL